MIPKMIDMSKYLSGASNPINKEEGSDKEGSQAEEEKLLTRLLKEYKIYIVSPIPLASSISLQSFFE
jgi:hypothetical protein